MSRWSPEVGNGLGGVKSGGTDVTGLLYRMYIPVPAWSMGLDTAVYRSFVCGMGWTYELGTRQGRAGQGMTRNCL